MICGMNGYLCNLPVRLNCDDYSAFWKVSFGVSCVLHKGVSRRYPWNICGPFWNICFSNSTCLESNSMGYHTIHHSFLLKPNGRVLFKEPPLIGDQTIPATHPVQFSLHFLRW